MGLRAAVVGALALIALAGCTFKVGQRTFLPVRAVVLPPLPADVTRENVELQVEPGLTLRGWHLRSAKPRNVVVFFHGNGAGISSSNWALTWLASALAADVVALDARGYGFSDGQASVDPIVEDALRIPGLLRALGLDARPLIVVGESMGTASAVHLAAHRPAAALVLISPFSSYRDLVEAIGRRLPWYARAVPDESLTGLATSPLTDLASVTAPTLMVHGARDELSTAAVVRRVEGACHASRKVVCTFDGAHGDANPINADVRACILKFSSGVWEGP